MFVVCVFILAMRVQGMDINYKQKGIFPMTNTMTYPNLKGAFPLLFQSVFQVETEENKKMRFIDYRRAIEARFYMFELDERFRISCFCTACKMQHYVAVWDLALALNTQSAVACTCKTGAFLPVMKQEDVCGWEANNGIT